MGGSPNSEDLANREAEEQVTVKNLDKWLFKLKQTVAILQESSLAKDVIIKDLTERLSKLEKGVGSGGGSTPPLFSSIFSNKSTVVGVLSALS